MQGEWWIIDGSATYADGDIGDMNHEGYVIEHVRMLVAEKCGMDYEPSGFADWDEIVREITAEHGISPDELDIANGDGDARQYGLEVLGWKRVVDGTVETWTFTKADRDDIVAGLWDMDDDCNDDDEGTEICISVASTGDYFSMTLGELEHMGDARPPMIAVELANSASSAVVRRMEMGAMHPCYKGRIGD